MIMMTSKLSGCSLGSSAAVPRGSPSSEFPKPKGGFDCAFLIRYRSDQCRSSLLSSKKNFASTTLHTARVSPGRPVCPIDRCKNRGVSVNVSVRSKCAKSLLTIAYINCRCGNSTGTRLFRRSTLYLTLRECPSLVRRTFDAIMGLIAAKKFHAPQPLQTFGISEVENAFRNFQSGRNFGKMIVEMREHDNVHVRIHAECLTCQEAPN